MSDLATKSLFDPQRYYTEFEWYRPLLRYDYPALGRVLKTMYDEEGALAFRADKLADDTAKLAEHLADVPKYAASAPALAAPMAAELQRMFNLEQLALVLSTTRQGLFEAAVEVADEHVVREVLAEDGNCLFVLPHYGPHFATTLLLAKLGIYLTCGGAMTEPFIKGICQIGEEAGLEINPADGILFTDDFKMRCAEALSGGKNLMLYPEYSRSTRTGRLLVDFLGTQVHGPTGIARLAAAFGKRMVGVALEPIEPFRYRLRFGPVWRVDADGGEEAIQSTIKGVFEWVERLVVASPGHWECWRYFQYMKTNTTHVALQALAEELRRERAKKSE
jgi:lauroyl/myristoyl acyltransferase